MHMADALLSPAVGGAMYAASAAALGYCAVKLKKSDKFEEALPVMAVTGALVFTGQMINFTIPGTGSSGHIGGGILLAAMLGPEAALFTMAAVLIVQCLMFADGGFLALGCNIFNMGVLPCLVAYPLLFRMIAAKGTARRIFAASILAVVVGLQLGAFCVVMETEISGNVGIPLGTFLLLMQPIHLAIGIVEGIVTGLVLNYVRVARPETLEVIDGESKTGRKGLLIALGVLALLLGTVISLMASGNPDGLEWALQRGGAHPEDGGGFLQRIQERTSLMPDYEHTSLSGIVGGILTVVLAGLTGVVLSRRKKRKKN